ncbi:hypothetical protein [Kitasatospora sp. NPDC007106]|uniref:hypothetical protein n=1 Tax=Kitasatospora sp. NPDC007106 TaxID=3156914 RepID=UPI0033EB0CE0
MKSVFFYVLALVLGFMAISAASGVVKAVGDLVTTNTGFGISAAVLDFALFAGIAAAFGAGARWAWRKGSGPKPARAAGQPDVSPRRPWEGR